MAELDRLAITPCLALPTELQTPHESDKVTYFFIFIFLCPSGVNPRAGHS